MPLPKLIRRFKGEQPALERLPDTIKRLYGQEMRADVDVVLEPSARKDVSAVFTHTFLGDGEEISVYGVGKDMRIQDPSFYTTLLHETAHAQDHAMVRGRFSELMDEKKAYTHILSHRFKVTPSFKILIEARAYFTEVIARRENPPHDIGGAPASIVDHFQAKSRKEKTGGRIFAVLASVCGVASVSSAISLFLAQPDMAFVAAAQVAVSFFGPFLAILATMFAKIFYEDSMKASGICSQYLYMLERGRQIGEVEAFHESTSRLYKMIDRYLAMNGVKVPGSGRVDALAGAP